MRDIQIEETKTLEQPNIPECASHNQLPLNQTAISSASIPIIKNKKKPKRQAELKVGFDLQQRNVYISPSRRKNDICNTLEPITGDHLVELLRTDPMSVLILDCREKRETFELGSILSAIHVPPLTRTEQELTPSIVEKTLSSYEDQIFFRQREFCRVVLYDHYDRDFTFQNDVVIDELIAEDRLYAMFLMLRQEALTSEIRYLKGGFVDFAFNHPMFCNIKDGSNDENTTADVANTEEGDLVNDSGIYEEEENIVSSVPNANVLSTTTSLSVPPQLSNFPSVEAKLPKINRGHSVDLTKSAVHEMTLQQRLKIAHGRLFSSFTRQLDCELPTQILDHLYLGSAQNSFNRKQLKNLEIRYIINTAKECVNHYPEHFLYMKCPMIDDEIEDATRYFDETYEFIENARSCNSKILVHCFMGMSRSATIVIAYLMKHKRWNLKAAFRFVREKRPIIELNVGFMYQLVEYEKNLLGISSFGKLPFSPKNKK
jgi:protein-tyrosine phosphatase